MSRLAVLPAIFAGAAIAASVLLACLLAAYANDWPMIRRGIPFLPATGVVVVAMSGFAVIAVEVIFYLVKLGSRKNAS